MKTTILLIALLTISLTGHAQDLIALSGGDTIAVSIRKHNLKKVCVTYEGKRRCYSKEDVIAFRYQGNWITAHHPDRHRAKKSPTQVPGHSNPF